MFTSELYVPLKVFLSNSRGKYGSSNSWFEFDNGKVYLRKGKVYIQGESKDCIQIATVEAYEKRKGFFTEVLEVCEYLGKEFGLDVYVENCMYDFLWKSLEKKNYKSIDPSNGIFESDLSKSFYKEIN